MHVRYITFQLYILSLLSAACLNNTAYGENIDDSGNAGANYAFLLITTISPFFAAANYTITNDDGSDVDISTARLPYHIDLMQNTESSLQLEIVVAYQQTEQIFQTFPEPGENIDLKWITYGAGLGLLYEYNISKQLRFTPSLRLGLATMENKTKFNGAQTNQVKDAIAIDRSQINWSTNASFLNLGIGLSYNWKILDRASSIKADVYHSFVDSFDESNEAIKFTEDASLLAVKADMIFPTKINIHDERLDFVLLLGANNFFGENRNTLGYTTSYQAGLGAEIPMRWGQSKYGHLRLSGEVLWAENMNGWLLSLGYIPN